MMSDIILRLKYGWPSVDVFADCQIHVCERWWGPGSLLPDAFTVHWGSEPLLWLNPPFTLLNRVVSKLKSDRAVGILIMPHWTNQPFFEEVKPYIVRKYFYRKGTMMFETESGTVGGTPWPVWALLVDTYEDGWMPADLEHSQFERTRSSTRRWRKKWQARPLC